MEEPEVLAAKARAEASRQRLMATVEEAKYRLAPSTIASNAVDGVRTKVAEAAMDLRTKAEGVAIDLRDRASDGVVTAKRNPLTVAAGAAVLALFLFRKPLWRLIGNRKPTRDVSAGDAQAMLPDLAATDEPQRPASALNEPA